MTTSEILDFWRWFASVSGDFGSHFENAALLKELDQRVTALGPFTWEVGPARSSNDSILVISPSGRAELLPETKAIVDLAPACAGWQFFSAKQPKDWQRRFLMNDSQGNQLAVDASEWRYVLYEYPDGVFDLVVHAPDLANISEQDQITAAEIVLDGELGEEARLSRINDIEIVVRPGDVSPAATTPITAVSDHLKKLTSMGRE